MEKLILKLAGVMLSDYADRLSRNGCNTPTDKIKEILSHFKEGEFEKMLDEYNGGECEGCIDYDWIISNVIGKKLIEMSEK